MEEICEKDGVGGKEGGGEVMKDNIRGHNIQ